MRTTNATILALGAVLLAGCPTENKGQSDTADSGGDWYSGPLQIATLDYSCTDSNPDAWWFYALADGYAGEMTLDIFETGDGNWPGNPNAVWSEQHDMTNVSWAQDGSWDEWDVTLSEVDSPSQVISGSTTLWDCWWNDGDSLAFMVTMWGEGGTKIDCAIFGNESQQYFDGYRGQSCVCFDRDGSCTN